MFTTILVASDGSHNADRLVQVAQTLARESRSKVVVAHVNELMAGRGGGQPVHPNEELLQLKVKLQVADLKAAGLDAEFSIRSTFGAVAPSIAEIARRCDADLIVTGSSTHGRFSELLFGSVGRRMPEIAPCPVLVVPSRN